MTDEELRDRLAEWARPIRQAPAPEIGVIRHRAGRRVRRRAVVAVAAVAVAGLAAILVIPRLLAEPGRPPATDHGQGSWFPAGPLPGPDAGPASAPFFVVLDPAVQGSPAVVYRVTERHPTPRRLATIAPGPGVTYTNVVAAGDDKTFVLVGARDSSKAPASMFFEFRLSRSGMPGRLHRLSVRLPDQPVDLVGDMALTADGTELAVAGQAGRVAAIQVLSLASGTVRTWSGVGSADWLSWIGDRALDFSWAGPAARAPEIVMLRTTSSGSLPGSSRVLVPTTARFGRFVRLTYGPATATSTAVFGLMASPLAPPHGPGTELGVVEFSARTGQPLRVIIKSPQSGMGSFCGVLWADRSGRQLVSSCGSSAGSTKDGRFTPWVPVGRAPFWSSLRSIPIAW